ncbi:hypothetical protein GCM10011415_28110 [Salipiger pallidus]|uniref:Uncharacterized protein n=1 Tax=Salipiger pallidus TaxID=1775170 RepID=A0A8J2ZLG7_9RHOB|nr:hypothetical protein [Salipiger pallidus]GGG77575.1 hypothetical protein GCM10011415_28110 [Salipiger pallidus]
MPPDPFLRSVEATFRRHGIAAVLDPDGLARPVKLLPTRPDGALEFGQLQVQDATGIFEILAVAFAGFDRGAVIQIGGERRKVQHQKVTDPRRYKVRLDTIPMT